MLVLCNCNNSGGFGLPENARFFWLWRVQETRCALGASLSEDLKRAQQVLRKKHDLRQIAHILHGIDECFFCGSRELPYWQRRNVIDAG